MRASQGLQKQTGDDEAIFDEKNYADYRKFLSRRISDHRQKLDKKMRKKGQKEYITSEEFGQVTAERCLLEAMLAERAWATALEIKQNFSQSSMHRMVAQDNNNDDENNEKGNKVDDSRSSLPRRFRLRLRKAALHAQTLRRAVENAYQNAKIVTEVQAMAFYLQGVSLELQNPELAVEELRSSTKLYAELASIGTAQQRDVYALRLSESRTALQRCEYALRLRGHILEEDDDTITKEDQPSSLDDTGTDLIVNWCGRSLAIAGEALQAKIKACPSLLAQDIDLLAETQNPFQFSKVFMSLEGQEEKKSEEEITKALRQLDEVSRTAIQEERALDLFKGGGERVQALKHDLNYLKARIQYDRLCLIAKRLENAVTQLEQKHHFHLAWRGANIVETTLKRSPKFLAHYKHNLTRDWNQSTQAGADEIIRLLDALSRVYADIAALEGITDGPDDSIAERLEAIKAAIRAQRCFFLAHTKNISEDKDTLLGLFSHTGYLCQRAQLEAEAAGIDNEKMDALAKEAKANLFRAILFSSMATESDAFNQDDLQNDHHIPIADCPYSHFHHHHQFHKGQPLEYPLLFEFPPKAKVIAPKPLLFNIAHNNLTFPLEKLDERAGISVLHSKGTSELATGSRSGLFGWFRGSRQAVSS
mmetsp:Transcript_21895/g.28368  ORF Transcript_21895/g.28368 Transcript_21895/m.28368 type:complete len:648 (-) Transcript_21895:149-2092(-)